MEERKNEVFERLKKLGFEILKVENVLYGVYHIIAYTSRVYEIMIDIPNKEAHYYTTKYGIDNMNDYSDELFN